MTAQSEEGQSSKKKFLPGWALALLALLILVGIAIGAVYLYRSVRDFAAAPVDKPAPVEFSAGDEAGVVENVVDEGMPVDEVSEEPLPIIKPDELEPWSGEERINFLFLGVDQRCDETGPTHTDSMMIVTVDPVGKSAGILSLPRDLWIEIPGFGVDRINQAYYFGQVYELPGGGQGLAMETVEGLMGIPVDYYLTVDFQGFIDAVDLIGGIPLDIPEAIDDPDYPDNCYGYEPFAIEAGSQLLDGETALKYARTRATLGGDVDRAGRQQAVLMAVRNQVLQLDELPQLFVQAPQLWRTFQGNVNTNLPLEDALELALLVQEIDPENIRTAVLDQDYIYGETTPDGRQVLVPRRDEIRALRDEFFPPPAVPAAEIEDLAQLMAAEEAEVALFNGTPVFGLAGDTQEYLLDLGVNVTEIGNADSAAIGTTKIIDYGAHPATIQFLIQEMGIPPLNFSSETDGDVEYDLLVIIGNDWASRFAGEE